MLTSYKKISIIYGGSGKEYADCIKQELDNLHQNSFYPIRVDLLSTDWVGHDILSSVIDTIRNSDLIYIIFTLDDVGASRRSYLDVGEKALVGRLRQNVLIELGMALVVVGKDTEKIKIIADFDKSDLGNDFPSDIRNALVIRSFTKDSFDNVVSSIVNHVCNDFGIEPTNGILHDEEKHVDFENVFDEFAKIGAFSEKKIKTLDEILDLWLPTLGTFDYVEERLLYALERLKSFPVFGVGDQLCDWIRSFCDNCLDPHLKITTDRSFMIFTQKLVKACLDYTIIKTDDETAFDLFEYKIVADAFKELNEEYNVFVENGIKFHPIISFVLLEYYGLSLMKVFNLSTEKDPLMADKIIDLFKQCLDVAVKMDTRFALYQGYSTFNLGRAYYNKYRLTKNDVDCECFNIYMKKTIKIRRQWKDYREFIQCFSNALSYEYFYAWTEYTRMRMLTEGDEYDYNYDITKIIDCIDDYICKDMELKKLYRIKNECIELYSQKNKIGL